MPLLLCKMVEAWKKNERMDAMEKDFLAFAIRREIGDHVAEQYVWCMGISMFNHANQPCEYGWVSVCFVFGHWNRHWIILYVMRWFELGVMAYILCLEQQLNPQFDRSIMCVFFSHFLNLSLSFSLSLSPSLSLSACIDSISLVPSCTRTQNNDHSRP